MPLAAPKLDDRHFQDIVDEAKKRIPYYIEEWTDHNVSDPGVTMIELFAWMTDIILYRLNQVPDLHYVKFMDLLGIRLKEPVPARVPVTFWLSAPLEAPISIPAGTEVASTQTETEPSIIFTTDEKFTIAPPKLVSMVSSIVTEEEERTIALHDPDRLRRGLDTVPAFTARPQDDDALYFGFEEDVSYYFLGFDLTCDPTGGAGIDPNLPPYVWEASTGSLDEPWARCDVDPGEDNTKGMNVSGRIRVHLPEMGKHSVGKESLFWVRVRVLQRGEYETGMRPYRTTPRLQQIGLSTWGGTTMATHAQRVNKEMLGVSDGSPGQRFQVQVTPVLQRRPGETLLVYDGEKPEQWVEVPDFSLSGPDDNHFTLDSVTGELRLGPAIRQPDGTMQRYGRIPPRNARLIFRRYRFGGGLDGNVQAGILNTLKTSIPYIARVNNRKPAQGGLDAETLEAAKMRTPAMLRSRDRAVTEADFEFLTREVLRDTGWGQYRVKCLQPRPARESRVIPGQVYVLIIPHINDPADRLRPKAEQLDLEQDEVYDRLMAYLNDRRLLTMRLDVRAPAYHWVAVRVSIHAQEGANHARVESEVLTRLYRFLNPLMGGADRQGWPFGRDLVVSDVYQCLQGVPGVQYIRQVELFMTSAGEGPRGDTVDTIEVVGHGVIVSGIHEVVFS
ncbi:MAG: putative baseplate assembly protein [Ardenticatenaceae bacterium]|nr:putative baseplate assembly protein [Anaerolineales bacterium]MCB8920855.1 putative baseplate assembly protein [Ardenticatenaceae bacterium]MCB8991631.1 putative baseplate assembly protein [Ardenticatenaceae bacterium]MCB9002727.1 putative baseplate assembly protein [Ardenticatenaceae bacterium]